MNGKLHCVLLTGHIPHGTLHRRVSCKLHCNIKKGTYCSFFKDINLFKRYSLYIIKKNTKTKTFILPKFKQSFCFWGGKVVNFSCKFGLQ